MKKGIFQKSKYGIKAQLEDYLIRSYEKKAKINVLRFLSSYAKRKNIGIAKVSIILSLVEGEVKALLKEESTPIMLADSQIAQVFVGDEYSTFVILPKIKKCLIQLSQEKGSLLEELRWVSAKSLTRLMNRNFFASHNKLFWKR